MISLDLDSLDGDQSLDSLAVSRADTVDIQIFGEDFLDVDEASVRFEFDPARVAYAGFKRGSVSDTMSVVGSDFVELSISMPQDGLLGSVRFLATEEFSGTDIRLVKLRAISMGDDVTYPQSKSIHLSLNPFNIADFNRDGNVDTADYVIWLESFGSIKGDGKYEARFDLDGNGVIGAPDFLIFVENFGK